MTATCTFAPTAAGTAAPSAERSADVSDETLVRETFSAEPDSRTAPATTRVCGAGVGEAEAIGVEENERDAVRDADSSVGDAAAPEAAGAAETDAAADVEVWSLEDAVAVDEAVGELEAVPVAAAGIVDELVDDAVAEADADTLGSADVVGTGRQPPEFAGVAPLIHSHAPSLEPFTSAVVAPIKNGAQL